MENDQTVNENKTVQLTIFDACPALLSELADTGDDETPESAENQNIIDSFDREFDEDFEDYKNKLKEFSAEISDYEERDAFEFDPATLEWTVRWKISLDW